MPVLCKLASQEEAQTVAAELRAAGKRLVLTNGCFDLLHPGHMVHLQQARDLGDALFLGLNSDRSVRELKGPERPIYPEMERALALSALYCVDLIVVFDETSPLAIIAALRPEVYVKGGDYTLDTLNQQERALLESCGSQICILPLVEDFSTSNIIKKLQNRG
jgi:D-beta-D-heptose 7-phosphate kinase/D-beta-D-heptose 1-phosphate adenosyltransferase